MRVEETALPSVFTFEPRVFGDPRGYFLETWRAERYAPTIGAQTFVQDNLSRSMRGVLRGLHYQEPNGQGKLVWAVRGAVFDVAADIRVGSPHFGRWTGVELSDENHRQIWIPPGFAHGFLTLSDTADIAYKCTDIHAPDCEHTIRWDDPDIGITWPDCGLDGPLLSDRDNQGKKLSEVGLPSFKETP